MVVRTRLPSGTPSQIGRGVPLTLMMPASVLVVVASRLPSCWPTLVTPSIFTGPAPTVSALSFQ
ncbi:MAG: hypothetical protein K8R60_04960 [Burkholderiales bacterium]|nr:hypothetical protein [Burkholderiales bacterium]